MLSGRELKEKAEEIWGKIKDNKKIITEFKWIVWKLFKSPAEVDNFIRSREIPYLYALKRISYIDITELMFLLDIKNRDEFVVIDSLDMRFKENRALYLIVMLLLNSWRKVNILNSRLDFLYSVFPEKIIIEDSDIDLIIATNEVSIKESAGFKMCIGNKVKLKDVEIEGFLRDISGNSVYLEKCKLDRVNIDANCLIIDESKINKLGITIHREIRTNNSKINELVGSLKKGDIIYSNINTANIKAEFLRLERATINDGIINARILDSDGVSEFGGTLQVSYMFGVIKCDIFKANVKDGKIAGIEKTFTNPEIDKETLREYIKQIERELLN
jgi:hypothetical protein